MSDPVTAEGVPSAARRDQQRNFFLGVINGAVFRVIEAFTDPGLVISWFLTQLGVSNFLVGAISPIRYGGGSVPQILLSRHLQSQPLKQPFYRLVGVIRVLAMLGLSLVIALVPGGSPWLLPLFYGLFLTFSVASGSSSMPFMDVVAKVIPPRRRGSFFSQRSFWGGVLALGASSLVGVVLAEPDGLRFPLNIALLFGISALTLTISTTAWSMIKEPPGDVVADSLSVGEQVKRGWRLLHEDPDYRKFLLSRLALRPAQAAGAFYILYAKDALGIPAQMIGVYMTARTAATIVSNLFWGRLSDRRGNRVVLQLTNALSLALPLLALLLGGWATRVPGAIPWLTYAYATIFVVGGAVRASSIIGYTEYLLDLAPAPQRTLYLGFTSTVLGLGTFSAMLGGPIVDLAGYPAVMVFAALFYGLALALSLSLAEPRAAQ